MNDIYRRINEAVKRLCGLRCWAVCFGPNTWTNMSIKLGDMVPRVPPGKHKTNPPSVQFYKSDNRIYVQGPWSIAFNESRGQRIVDHSMDALELTSKLLTGATLIAARTIYGTGVIFEFSSGVSLLVKQERLLGDDPVEPVVTVFFEHEYFTLMSDGTIQRTENGSDVTEA